MPHLVGRGETDLLRGDQVTASVRAPRAQLHLHHLETGARRPTRVRHADAVALEDALPDDGEMRGPVAPQIGEDLERLAVPGAKPHGRGLLQARGVTRGLEVGAGDVHDDWPRMVLPAVQLDSVGAL